MMMAAYTFLSFRSAYKTGTKSYYHNASLRLSEKPKQERLF